MEKLEDILEWDVPFRQFENDVNASIQLFNAGNLNLAKYELVYSTKEHHLHNTHLHLFGIFKCSSSNDITGIQNIYPAVQRTIPFCYMINLTSDTPQSI